MFVVRNVGQARAAALARREVRNCRRGSRITKTIRQERAANRRARERLARELETELVEILERWDGSVSRGAIESHLIADGVVGVVDGPLKYGQLESDITVALKAAFEEAIAEGVVIGDRFSPLEGVATSGPDVTERALRWIDTDGLDRIGGINGRGRDAIAEFLRQQVTAEITPTEAARQIGNVVGLDERSMTALQNFEAKLVRRRIPTPEADTAAIREAIQEELEAYRDKLLRRRGEAIADTEVSTAIHEGERQYWEQAAADGYVEDPQTIRKKWRTAGYGNVCEWCRILGREDPIPLGDYFVHPNTGESVKGPTLHTRCRCYLEYSFEEREAAA